MNRLIENTTETIKDIVDIGCETLTNKFTLCTMMAQLGKTFIAVNNIKKKVSEDVTQGRCIHMIFTMNTLLNNAQFSYRLKELEETYGKGSVVIFASSYMGEFTHVSKLLELIGLCAREKTTPRIVVCCSNVTRFDEGVKFLRIIDNDILHVKRMFVIYDELHKYINPILRKQVELINDLPTTQEILALSATPEPIFDKVVDRTSPYWSTIRILPLDDYDDANYVGCSDMTFCTDNVSDLSYYADCLNPMDFKDFDKFGSKGKGIIGYIKYILEAHPNILAKGTRTFIPAHNIRVTHDAVRDIVFKLAPTAVIVVLNGVEKSLQYIDNDGTTISLSLISVTDEVCKTIADIIFKYELHERPIVITGFICVGMGQTLTHKDLGSFTSSIIGHLYLSNDDLYQLFGRNTGRMKNWETYVKTKIYCPLKIMQRCQVVEECAKAIAREYKDGESITLEDYRKPMTYMGDAGTEALNNIRVKPTTKEKVEDTDKEHRVFNTQEEARDYVNKHFKHRDGTPIKFNKRNDKLAPQEIRKRHNNQNPTVEGLLEQMWGVNDHKLPIRMFITCENTWCIYWRPSIIQPSIN